MFRKHALVALSLIAAVLGQQVGTQQAETHPTLQWSQCTSSGCTAQSGGAVVLDANWRWTHTTTGFTNCYTGNTWNTTICPDDVTCAANCALDGADYSGTYGITTSGNALTLKFITNSAQKNIGSRVYLMADESHYEIFKLLGKEFTFDVDLSTLPCGLNGALYFSQMDADGGVARFSTNKAGAKYGTGYCDSQCPRDIKFIDGQANAEGWQPSPNDTNAGTGTYGSCCSELDVWEANSVSAAYTPHPCEVTEQTRCSGTDCAIDSRYEGVCDPDGCDFNSFRMGDKTFYGNGLTVDTSRPFTVVTQFLTSGGSLSEIRRLYVQDGQVIPNSQTNIPGMSTYDSITTDFCNAQKTTFGDTNSFQEKGGMAGISAAMNTGMVLVLSIWDDHAVNMLWLDSDYPTDADPTKPGVARGTCPTTSGQPSDVESSAANAAVIFSNIRFGDFNTTYTPGSGPQPGQQTTTPSQSTTSTASGSQQTHYGQCGGIGWTGLTSCVSGTTCQVLNPYYSQCL